MLTRHSSRASRSTYGGWLRFLAAFVLLQFGGLQLWPALHHALTAHASCVEHGELVHAGEHDHAPGPGAADQEPSIQANGAADHAHDHCDVPPGTSERAVREPLAVAVAEAPWASTVTAPSAELNASLSIPLLSLAPKQSPPRYG